MRRLTIVLVLLALTSPARAGTQPDVFAHRGGADLAPENTLGAFRQAHAARPGYVWLELDTQPTKDGVLVVIHDDSLDRTTDCTGKVIAKTYLEIAPCDASASYPGWPTFERVPRLSEVLTEGRDAGWRLMVEIKNIPGEANFEPAAATAARALVELVRETGFSLARLVVQSFWPPALDQVELLEPAIRTALLTTSQLPGAPPNVGFTALENALFSKARGYDIIAPDWRSADLNPDTVAAIHTLGLPVVVWTVNAPADIRTVLSWGVDGVISDRPDLVYAARDSS